MRKDHIPEPFHSFSGNYLIAELIKSNDFQGFKEIKSGIL